MSDSLPTIPERTPLRVALTFVGGLLAFLVFGVAIWLIVQSHDNMPTVEDSRAKARLDYKADAETAARKLLETYGWVDEAGGIAHVPVGVAMQAVVRDYEHKPVGASSVPVPGTAAAEAAAAALLGGGAGSEPAPPAGQAPTDAEPVPEAETPAPESAGTVNPEALIPADGAANDPPGGDAPADAAPADAAEGGLP